MSGHREGPAASNVEGYSMHGEGSEAEGRRALSGDGHLARAGLWVGRAFVVARGARAWSRGGTRGRRRCEKSVRVRVACCWHMGGEARQEGGEDCFDIHKGMMPGTPSPPSSVGVRTRSVVLHSEPRAVMGRETPPACA